MIDDDVMRDKDIKTSFDDSYSVATVILNSSKIEIVVG
jgi:hypothetical protein